MKTPQQAATKYGTNGSAPTAVNLWATNYNSNMTAIFDAAARNVGLWQSAVADPAAATRFVNGLNKAKGKTSQIATKVTNVGAPALAAGVRAASTGSYLAFANQWMPAVQQEVATLDQTAPRGTRQQNRARQAAYDAWVDSQQGNFKQ